MAKLRTILLVVDAQEGLRNSHTEGAIASILKFLRTSDGPAVFTRFMNRTDSNFERLLDWSKMKSGPETAILREISPFVTPKLVFEKSGYSAFTNPLFAQYLRDVGAKSIDICGFDTDACVLATAIDAFDAGYQPRILVEACASSGGADFHNNSIEILQRNLGKEAIVRGRTI